MKADINRLKHEIEFEFARLVFVDPDRVAELDSRRDYAEDRFITTGTIEGRLYVVVSTMRGEFIRIVSTRKADERERVLHDNRPKQARPQ